jgi:UDP-glucose 4-epimerase
LTGNHPMRLHDLFTMFSEILGRDIEVEYISPPEGHTDSHYRVTPYAFNPRVGRKLTDNYYVDMGQGLLQMLDQIYEEGHIKV